MGAFKGYTKKEIDSIGSLKNIKPMQSKKTRRQIRKKKVIKTR